MVGIEGNGAGSRPARDSSCWKCGTRVDALAPTTFHENPHEVPRPGDVSICIYCAALNVFAVDLSLRQPEPNEIEFYLSNPEVRAAIKAVIDARDLGKPD